MSGKGSRLGVKIRVKVGGQGWGRGQGRGQGRRRVKGGVMVRGSSGWSQGGAVGFSGGGLRRKENVPDSIPFQSIPFHVLPNAKI